METDTPAETTRSPKSSPARNANNNQLKNADKQCTSCEFSTTSTKLLASHIVRKNCKDNWTIKIKITMMGTKNQAQAEKTNAHTIHQTSKLGAIPKQPRGNP